MPSPLYEYTVFVILLLNNSNFLKILSHINIPIHKKEYLIDIKINNININSKYLKKNDLFISIKGKKYNNNNFIEEAIKKGSKAIITDKRYKSNYKKIPIIYDSKIKYKLSNLLKFFYKNDKIGPKHDCFD